MATGLRAKKAEPWEMTTAEYGQYIRERLLETVFQQQIIDFAAAYGWTHVYHTHDSRKSRKGWPDLVLGREPGEVLFWEVKRGGGKHSPETEEQKEWIRFLQACGQEARFVYPKHWNDYIEPRLTAPRSAA